MLVNITIDYRSFKKEVVNDKAKLDEIHTNDSETVIRVKCIIEPIYNTVHGTLTTQQHSNYANSNDVFLLNRLILNYHSEGTNQATLK